MDTELLHTTAAAMLAQGKGILAADESNSTAGKRLESIGLENTEENRRRYRDLFLSTEGIENMISGVILYDETLRQSNLAGASFVDSLTGRGIVPGIKVDMGAKDFPGFPGEKVTEGLDKLPARLAEYFDMGARFAKWRAVIRIGDGIPTQECIHTNAIILARYARMCQEAGIVPMVEPEVLLSGTHSMEVAEEVTTKTVQEVFYQAKRYRADLSGMILKTSMVLPGDKSGQEATPEDIASATVRMLQRSVPEEVPGVVFLSGGQEPVPATEHLDAIADLEPFPWEVAFSYARAIQGPALDAWKGKDENIEAAREVFTKRLRMNVAADRGVYSDALEEKAQ